MTLPLIVFGRIGVKAAQRRWQKGVDRVEVCAERLSANTQKVGRIRLLHSESRAPHHNPKPALQSFLSAALCGLDFGDVDLAHVHHRGEDAFGFGAAGGQRVR